MLVDRKQADSTRGRDIRDFFVVAPHHIDLRTDMADGACAATTADASCYVTTCLAAILGAYHLAQRSHGSSLRI